MMKGSKLMRRIYRAKNGVEEVTQYYVPSSAKPRTGKRNASSERKQEQNKNSAAHILGRIINNNFSQGDLLLSPGYDKAAYRDIQRRALAKLPKRHTHEDTRNAILAEVDADATNFIRRIKAAGAKDLKYIICPSDMDGTTGKEVRAHIHIIISANQFQLVQKKLTINGKTLENLWGKALSVEYEFLRGGSYNKLAAYLIRQTRTIPNRKKYRTSRTLEKIEPEEFEVPILCADDEIAIPSGAVIEERQFSAETSMQYVRYIPKPKPPKAGGHKG